MLHLSILCVFCLSPAQTENNIWPDFGKDKVGDFVHTKSKKPGDERYFSITVLEVIDDQTLLCKLGPKPPFLVTKYKHKDVVDESIINLKGNWRCVGTKKHNGATRWVIEPAPEKKKEK